MYNFFQVLFKQKINLLFGWSYLSLTLKLKTEGMFVCTKNLINYIDLLKDFKYRSKHTLL